MDSKLHDYAVITGNYWAFTLTDGALRMLVVLHFHSFGIVTNAVGGWLGARIGLNRTMQIGLLLQIGALSMLLVPEHMLSVTWVMVAQALSGIAKDLNKMSAKSSMKSIASDQNDGLYRIVAFLTGSKNALKGAGFFGGALLLSVFDFQGAIIAMVVMLTIVWVFSLLLLRQELGVMKHKPAFNQIFSKSTAVNWLSLARFFLFGARDVWFVVALPVFLHTTLQWDFWQVGGYLASWIIIYGFIQAVAPRLTGKNQTPRAVRIQLVIFGGLLALVPAGIAISLTHDFSVVYVVTIGLLMFALLFAMNSALHSYLIIRFARTEGASLDIGFYYMANAGGRLAGTVASGALFQVFGLDACLWVSALMIAYASITALLLPQKEMGTA